MHNPFAQYRVTDTWRPGHQAIDYGMDEGTPFGAPAAGIYRHDGHWDDAGIRGSLVLPDRSVIRFAHLEAHLAEHGEAVAEAHPLALSGNTGQSSGPHMHTYGLTPAGGRWNWTLDAGSRPAGVIPANIPAPTSTTNPQEDRPMHHLIQIDGDKGPWYLVDFAAGPAQRLHNHVQLDIVKAYPTVVGVSGPQPRHLALKGLAIRGE